MSELIDSFDRLKAEELHKTQAAQKEIVRLLQTLARKLEHMENPSRLNADRLAEMKSDLDFKQMQMGNSASTSERSGTATTTARHIVGPRPIFPIPTKHSSLSFPTAGSWPTCATKAGQGRARTRRDKRGRGG